MVISVNSWRPSGTNTMPALARAWADRFVTSSPWKNTDPLMGCINPMTVLSKVVLPTPLLPTRVVSLPGSSLRLTPRGSGRLHNPRQCRSLLIWPWNLLRQQLRRHFGIAQVGLDHLRIVSHFFGQAGGNQHAVIQNQDAVRDSHNGLHDVFDHENLSLIHISEPTRRTPIS